MTNDDEDMILGTEIGFRKKTILEAALNTFVKYL